MTYSEQIDLPPEGGHQRGSALHLPEEGLKYFAALYGVEREARELKLNAQGRHGLRQQRAKPIAEALMQWFTR